MELIHLTEESKLSSDIELTQFSVNNEAIQLHDHTFFEFFVVLKNRAIHFFNGKTEKLPQGTLSLIRPGDFHTFIKAPQKDSEIMNLIVANQTLLSLFGFLNIDSEHNILINSPEPATVHLNHNQLTTLQLTLEEINNSAPSTYSMQVKKLILNLTEILLTNDKLIHPSPSNSYFPSWLDQLLIALNKDENYLGGIDFIYNYTKKSPSQICKTFKRYLGQTPTAYINHLKLSQAIFLLKTTDNSIISIAFDCGFTNISHFNHEFKKSFGTTPQKYRTSLK